MFLKKIHSQAFISKSGFSNNLNDFSEYIFEKKMIFSGALGMFMLHVQYQQLCRLIESIKNSKYLVGQRLVNYDPAKKPVVDAAL